MIKEESQRSGRVYIGLLAILLIACMSVAARMPSEAGSDKGAAVKKRLIELFALCKADDFREAASYCAYRGPDASRKWKDVYNFESADERAAVESICERIKGYLNESDSHRFGRFTVNRESEGEWKTWEVLFARDRQIKRAHFSFLDIDGRYALGDID